MHEAGATADLELAYTLADGLEYIRTGIAKGLDIDDFAPRLSFFWGIGMDHFTEVAKLRAARVIWSEIVQSFNPKNPKSLALRAHCQTSGWSLTARDPYNNIARTTFEAISAVMGGTQSLHTNAMDEALALPTDHSAAIARETQLFLQNETDMCHIIDPYGGSDFIESLTHDLIVKAWAHIGEIESMGGMSRAIDAGLPKMRIEEAAARRQAHIDSGSDQIVGVNAFEVDDDTSLNLLEIDNTAVTNLQLERLKKVRASRDQEKVRVALDNLTKIARSTNGNLLEAAINAARHRATLGEISDAMEVVFGRYIASPKLISGVYAKAAGMNDSFLKAREASNRFSKLVGRRPRIMVAKLGQDGHDRGSKVIATSFADLGWDVDIGPLFQTPEEAARQATENDVHVLGISSLAAGHKILVPATIASLKALGRDDIVVVVGGIIPPNDHALLYEQGVAAIFGPGTIIAEAAKSLLEILETRVK